MKNIAVFGAGRIGRIHATNLAAQPGVKLKSVCDAVPAAAAAVQAAAQLVMLRALAAAPHPPTMMPAAPRSNAC